MELGLYIHIPFCKNLCKYCDFCKFINQKDEVIAKYFLHLEKELLSYEKEFNKITSIYIGGGTPNSVDIKYLKRLFEILDPINPIEFSIECNVELITDEFISLLKTTKVNRISLGIQTFNEAHIKEINRFHSKEQCITTIKKLRENNFNNINIDLMYGLKNQTLNDVLEDLALSISLDVEHVSYYSLILEENSVYGKLNKDLDAFIENDLEAKMYLTIIKELEKANYEHYEISNFSKKGYNSIHNILYWKRGNYIGCGASSASYYNFISKKNSNVLSKYYNLECDSYEIDEISQQQEFFWLGLRLINGVNLDEFYKRFNVEAKVVFKIDDLIEKDLLEVDLNNNLKFTKKGLLQGNYVFSYFI